MASRHLPRTEMAQAWDKMSAAHPELIRRCRHDLLGFFLNRNMDVAQAEDLVQATLLATVCQVHRWRRESSFKHYVMSVAHNVLGGARRAHARRRSRLVSMEEEKDSVLKTVALEPLADAVLIDRDALSRVELQLDALPEPYRAVVALRLQGYTNGEIAETTGLHYHTVRSRLSRGLRRIREALSSDGA